MTAIGYVRVSTNGQADGFGPELQREAIEGSGRQDGISAWYSDEGVSGKLMDRPGLGDALAALEAGDVLVVAKLDRLARDLITQEMLLREIRSRGAELVSCAEGEQAYLADDAADPSRRLIRQVLGAVAEYERSMISLRLSMGRRAKRKAGGYAGGETPFGYRSVAGELVMDDREQSVIAEMRRLRSDGFELAEVATILNGFGMEPRRGTGWRKQSVHRVLARAS